MQQKRSKLTKSDFKVGDKVQVICKACDFYFFRGTETGTVVRITDSDYLCIIVEFDKPMLVHDADDGVWTKKDHNFHPYDLVILREKKYVRISRAGMGSYIQPLDELATALDGEFDGAQVGDQITLELVAMDETEYEALPEFGGW